MSGYRTRREWGWHSLTAEWAHRVVAAAGVRSGERVIDVGAGTGALTDALLAAGASVIAVELHPGRAQQLRARFDGCPVSVVTTDMAGFRWPRSGFRVLANPPFHQSAALLRALTAPRSGLRRADLVLQRAVVQRWTVAAPHRFRAVKGISLPRKAFRPPPRVDTAVLQLRRR